MTQTNDLRASETRSVKPASSRQITIRPLNLIEDFDAAINLERAIWSYSDLDTDSRAILVIASRFIGQILGAWDEGRLVGMALAFYADQPACLHSHRVGVLSEYQNQRIGYRLKLAQRGDAIARGFRVIQWTFDPLQSRNAHFNITRLGGIARTYIPDLYGKTSSPLHGGLPTDRLLIEWHLNSRRVTQTIGGCAPHFGESAIRIELPPRERRTDPGEQQQLREAFQQRFTEGYAVVGFSAGQGCDAYTLEKL